MKRSAVAAALSLAFAGAAGASETQRAEPFVGVTHVRIVQAGADDVKPPKLARPCVVNLLEIDTRAAGIRFELSPGNGDAPGEITRGTTRAFVDRAGAQLGINVGFYDTKSTYGGLHTDLMNLASSDGVVYSNAKNASEWVFDVTKDGRPRIAKADAGDGQTVDKGTTVYNAAGGNQPMLRGGEVVTPDDAYTKALNPHTAVGISRDKTKVYFIVCDGRQPGYSEGLRTDELAALMKQFGAWDAINFDGGGSTTMAMDDTDDGKANSRLVNSPSDRSSPAKAGTDREVANSLAVFAKPKPGYVAIPDPPRPKLEDALALLTARTLLDDFESGPGHFDAAAMTSGSNRGVDASSTAVVDPSIAQAGKASLKVTLVADPAKADDGQLRLLSGGAIPTNNAIGGKAMGNDGFVGVYLRREPGGPPLFVSLVVDEGLPNAHATERGPAREVVADGRWHLVEWGLNEDAKWSNYNAGNGKIDGPNVFVDSLLFRTTNADNGGPPIGGAVWIDSLTYEPSGYVE